MCHLNQRSATWTCAFRTFFDERANEPTFKKQHARQSAEDTPAAFTWDGTPVTLARMSDPLPRIGSRPLPKDVKPPTSTVSKDPAGRSFVALLMEEDLQPWPVSPKSVGSDRGV